MRDCSGSTSVGEILVHSSSSGTDIFRLLLTQEAIFTILFLQSPTYAS